MALKIVDFDRAQNRIAEELGTMPVPPKGRFDDEDELIPHPGQCQPGRRGPTLEWLGPQEILGPLPTIEWVNKDLALCPGRPSLWAGYGYSGKTITAQAMALALAGGVPIWGHYRVNNPIRVAHLDYEQGEHATRRRYHRLAFAAGVDAERLGDRLKLVCLPSMYLTDASIEDTLCRELDGCQLAIWDSLRALVPGVDENDSGIRRYLDVLIRVSHRVQCASLLIHHAGKGGNDKEKREVLRGSSAIFDACGTVYTLHSTAVGEPIRVKCIKTTADADAVSDGDFYLTISDMANDDASNTRAGLQVTWQNVEQVEQPQSVDRKLRDVQDRIVSALRKQRSPLTLNSLQALTGVRRQTIVGALDLLVTNGTIDWDKASGRGAGRLWKLADLRDGGEE